MTISHPPTLPYKNLTIVLSRPSRFDIDSKKLLTANAGEYFKKLLSPITPFNCDIRLPDDPRPLLPDTKLILALGQEALSKFAPNKSLLTYRGSPLVINDTTLLISTITPQDSFDRINYENDEEEEGEEEKATEKDYQKTKRKNFKFWLYADTKKAIRILTQGLKIYPEFKTVYAPPIQSLINNLRQVWKNGYLTLDIETDRYQNLTCFTLLWTTSLNYNEQTAENRQAYVIPFKTYNKSLFYSHLEYCYLFVALAFAFRNNTVVGHNLLFDLFILLYKYKIHLPNSIYDTMVAHHRLHPEIEKSLGHCVSYYTDFPYHKDEGVFEPLNLAQQHSLWMYNAKDVITTYIIACEQQAHLVINRAAESALQAFKTIPSLLTMQLEGALCNTDKLCKIVDECDKKMELYKRILSLMTKRTFNPGSWQQVSHYLYDELKLPKPPKDPTKEDNLLKLYAKYRIPSLRLILAYRGEGKMASSLRKIRMWKDDRLTCAYLVTGTDTFRLASRELLSFEYTEKKN